MKQYLFVLRGCAWSWGRILVLIVFASTLRLHATEVDSICSSDLLPLIEEPYASVEGALARLTALEEVLLEAGDRRVIFLSIYVDTTRAVDESLEAGFFLDNEWIADLTVVFANFYRQAFLDFECGELQRVPEAWQIAYETTLSGEASVLQAAALGINAHINHDLAEAVYQVSIDPFRVLRHLDYTAIDLILANLTDSVLVVLILARLRETAWRFGVKLTDAPSPEHRQFVLSVVDEYSAALARRISGLE